MRNHSRNILTPQMIRELGAEAVICEKSIRRAYAKPDTVRPSTLERLRRAAAVLNIQPPPEPIAGRKVGAK